MTSKTAAADCLIRPTPRSTASTSSRSPSRTRRRLRVHFLNAVALQGTLTGQPDHHRRRDVPSWPCCRSTTRRTGRRTRRPAGADAARPRAPATSRLHAHVASPRLDRYLRQRAVLVQGAVPDPTSTARRRGPYCPPPDGDAPPIDYLAKDFLSFRQALLDFSALRYPDWQERSEADFGMMFLEALASAGRRPELHAGPGRRRGHARHRDAAPLGRAPRPAGRLRAAARDLARVLLQFDVRSGPLPAGLPVSRDHAGRRPIAFEMGTGLLDPDTRAAQPGQLPGRPALESPAVRRGGQPGAGQRPSPAQSAALLLGRQRALPARRGHRCVAARPGA